MNEHILVLGPSGVGKSAVAAYVARERNYTHLEVDQFPNGDGIDLENLRPEWDEFFGGSHADALAHELTRRAKIHGTRACILSFPSGLMLSPQHIQSAADAGIRVRCLYGSAAACISSFLLREEATGRNLGLEHWILNNASAYMVMSRPEYASIRVEAFHSSESHVSFAELAAELCDRGAV